MRFKKFLGVSDKIEEDVDGHLDNFDEAYYLAVNNDIDFAVSKGDFQSGKEHYLKFGHKENRKISPPKMTDELGGGIYPAYHL